MITTINEGAVTRRMRLRAAVMWRQARQRGFSRFVLSGKEDGEKGEVAYVYKGRYGALQCTARLMIYTRTPEAHTKMMPDIFTPDLRISYQGDYIATFGTAPRETWEQEPSASVYVAEALRR